MRYKIEYLAHAAVVHLKTPYGASLDAVAGEARNGAATARALFGADGFQIRDMNEDGKVVMIEGPQKVG